MAKPRPETSKLIQYLLQVMPESLEAKSSDGYTPLALAFSLHRFDAAKLLIDAGADQTVRSRDGCNIVHLLLVGPYNTPGAHKKEMVQAMLELIDRRLLPSLFTERSSRQPGSLTPIANWMRTGSENESFLRMLLDFMAFTNNEHLELLDGAGDTPLHYTVSANRQDSLKTIIEYRPDLLFHENSVGRTPYELAEDAYISVCVKDVPGSSTRQSPQYSITTRAVETFVKDYEPSENVTKESIWRICEDLIKKHPGKRRLVSLLDANEVAKRLANRHIRQSYVRVKGDEESDAGSDVPESNEAKDEVRQWYVSLRR